MKCEKEFPLKNDTKHSLFMILVENFALLMGSYFKIFPWLWVLIFKMLPGLWVLTLNSQRHIYTRPPIGVTPPPRDRSITVHQRNLQYLMTEMYKTKNGLNPALMREIFCEHARQYNLRNSNDFSLPRIKTVTYSSETIRFRGPQVRATVPQFIKNSASLTEFKNKIKSWSGESCHCQ